MQLPASLLRTLLALLLGLGTCQASGSTPTPPDSSEARLTLAVAANFRRPMQQLLAELDAPATLAGRDRLQYTVVSGATGTLYAQIVQGAPFDVFFAADAQRPTQLIASGHALPDSLRIYASGILALAYRDPDGRLAKACDGMIDDTQELARLIEPMRAATATRPPIIAMANPRIAPYGAAAAEVLDALPPAHSVEPRHRIKRVLGRNVLQAQQFLETGHADFAMVAYSLRTGSGRSDIEFCPLADTMHAPVTQALVVVDRPRSQVQEALLAELLAFIDSGRADRVTAPLGYRARNPHRQ